MRTTIILTSFLCIIFQSCFYHKEKEQPTQTNGCDTTNIYYSTQVKTILENNCYSCHSTAATTTSGGLDLENFNSLKNYLNNQYHQDSIYGSKFYHVIDQIGTVPYMPPTSKLTFCELRKIKIWIDEGAPFN